MLLHRVSGTENIGLGLRRYEFVLRNNTRSSFLVGDSQPLQSGGIFLGFASFAQGSGGGDFSDLILTYPPRSTGAIVTNPRPSGAVVPVLDADWLRDADIAIVETEYRGKLSRDLTIDGFKMKP